MTIDRFSNNAATTLTAPVDNVSDPVTLSISNPSGFPQVGSFRVIIGTEIFHITAGAGTTSWTASRAQEGTVIASHATNDVLTHVVTAFNLNSLRQDFNVIAYGAKGDGITDDTTAIEAAYLASSGVSAVYFPPGNYIYNGSGLGIAAGYTKWNIKGSGKQSTTITVGASSYFIASAGNINQLYLGGISFVGGLGYIHLTSTAVMSPTNPKIVENCDFTGYTSCAITDNHSDCAFWRIRDCQFQGANATATIGVAIAGPGGDCELNRVFFESNLIHAKFGEGGLGVRLIDVTFLQYASGPGTNRVSLWVVPKVTSVNAGIGLTMDGGKFGNENLDTTDYRVLYADGSGGGDFGTDLFNIGADSTGFIIDHSFNTRMATSGAPGATRAMIYSTTPNVQGLWFRGIQDGNAPAYIIQYRTVPLAPNRFNARNYFGPFLTSDASSHVSWPLSNAIGTGYLIEDPDGLMRDNQIATNPSGGADFSGFAKLNPDTISGFTLSGMTSVGATDSEGLADALELTATSTGSAANDTLTTGNIVVGDPIWIEFDLKQGSSLPMTTVTVKLEYTSGGSSQFWQRTLTVPTNWRRYRYLTFSSSTSSNNRISFVATGWVTGTATKVQIGRVRVYHAREPQIYNLHLGSPASVLVPGVTSFSLRNNANNADNFLITDAGNATMRGTLGGLTGLTVASGGETITAGDLTLTAGKIVMSTAASRLVPGATSFAVRDTANANDNLLVTDAGNVTARGTLAATTLTLSLQIILNQAASKIIPGATSFSLRNNANSADNLLVADAGNITVRGTLGGLTGLTIASGGETITAGDLTLTAGKIVMSTAVSQVVPGATSLSLRNNANSADNILVADAGGVTFRAGLSGITTLSMSSTLTMSAANSKIVPGATNFSHRNSADSADNLLISDAGIITTRSDLSVGGHWIAAISGTPATSNLGANVTSVTFTGNDVRGKIVIVMSGALAANTRIATCTWNTTFGAVTPLPLVASETSGAGLAIVNFYSGSESATAFDLFCEQALAAGTYTIRYVNIG